MLSDDSIRTDQAVNQLVLSFTFRIKRVDLSAVWIVTRHPCYEACGPWIGTNLRCLVIMKTYRPSTVHYSPPSLQPEGSVSNHLDRLRFITAHFHRPRSPPRPKLCSRLSVWIFRYTFWTLIIARIDRGEPGQSRQRTHAMRRKNSQVKRTQFSWCQSPNTPSGNPVNFLLSSSTHDYDPYFVSLFVNELLD